MKKRILSLALALLMVIAIIPGMTPPASSAQRFIDVTPDDWFYEDVNFLAEIGFMSGTGVGVFNPHQLITRAEVSRLICRTYIGPFANYESENDLPDDVDDEDQFADSVMYALDNGFMVTSEGLFRPDDEILKQEMALIMAKFYTRYDPATTDLSVLAKFSDQGDIDADYKEGVAFIVDKEKLFGSGESTFSPKAELTRGSVAAFFARVVRDTLINIIADPIFAAAVREIINKPTGPITAEDVEEINELDVSSMGIESLEGIEYFIGLKELDCSWNELTELDVSNNTALTYIYCFTNQLTELDVSNNTALTSLSCSDNQLETLNVSGATELRILYCSDNQLEELNVSDNAKLMILYCYSNQLEKLDLSDNSLALLTCSYNQLTELDLRNNIGLRELSCGNNQLTEIDVSVAAALTQLGCDNNQLTELDVSSNTALEIFSCSDNQLTTLDVSNNPALEMLQFNRTQLTELDVSNNPALKYLLCSDNQLEELDVSDNKALERLFCNNNKLTELDVSENTVLTFLDCRGNYIRSKDDIKGLDEDRTTVIFDPQKLVKSDPPPAGMVQRLLWNLSEDYIDEIVAEGGTEDCNMWTSGDVVYSKDGSSLKLSGRSEEWESLDVVVRETLADGTWYTVTVKLRAEAEQTFALQQTDDPHESYIDTNGDLVEATGTEVTLTFTSNQIGRQGVRAKTIDSTDDYWIDSVEVYEWYFPSPVKSDPPPADMAQRRLWNLSESYIDEIVAEGGTDDGNMAQSGDVVFSKDGSSLKLSGRSVEWESLDVVAREILTDGTWYTVTVKLRAEAEQTFALQQTDSPYESYIDTNGDLVEATGTEVTLTFTSNQIGRQGVRAKTIESTGDYWIDSVEVYEWYYPPAPDDPPPPPPPPPPPDEPDDERENVVVVVIDAEVSDEGVAEAKVTEEQIEALVEEAVKAAEAETDRRQRTRVSVKVELTDEQLEEANTIDVSIPAAALETIAGDERFELAVETPFATMVFDAKALETIIAAAGLEEESDIRFSIEIVDTEGFDANDLRKIGDRPVFDFNVWNGDTQVSKFQGGKANISIPYELLPGENPNAIVVYYMEDGKLQQSMGKYNAEKGTVDFAVTHFSVYAIAYNLVEFDDVDEDDEYYDAVVFLAARGITDGMAENKYVPGEGMTRAMVLVMIMRAYGLTDEALYDDLTDDDYWADVTAEWAKNPLALAKKRGITKGTNLERNEFSPDRVVEALQLELLINRAVSAIEDYVYDEPDYEATEAVSRGQAALVMWEYLTQ